MHTNYVLVVGGAGFIGSHMVLDLQRAGYIPVVLDNLSKGHSDAVKEVELVIGDMADTALLNQLFNKFKFSAVMHFGAWIEVAESMQFPAKYYQNNVSATVNLLDVMIKNNVKRLIFSSTAAVYGEPQSDKLTEFHKLAPLNPYGRSKWMVEEIIKDFARSNALQFAILRYFNAAGADVKGKLCERHEPESHLIPLALQAAAGLRSHITIYGNDYPTLDGTCIRDYVHVMDLCNAHKLALQALIQDKNNMIYNLGTGRGYSVLQVIETARMVTGKNIIIQNGGPRLGDPAVLVADASLANKELQWQPQYPELETIIEHSWQAMQQNLQ